MDAIIPFVAIAVVLLVAGLMVWRMRRQASAGSAAVSTKPVLSSEAPIVHRPTGYLFQWPFGDTGFDEVVREPARFAEALDQTLADNINRRLWGIGIGDTGNIIVQAVSIAASHGTCTVAFSLEGQRLLDIGRATIMGNGARPTLLDASGKIIENARIVSFPRCMQALASVSSIVVSAAHIISSANLAQQIQEVDRKIDWLITVRNIDQWAKLEGIFYAARELCAQPINEVRQMELRKMRRELRELRAALRREWQARLGQIPVNTSKFDDLIDMAPFFGNMRQVNRQNQVKAALDETVAYPLLLEFIWRLDLVLAIASQSEEGFSLSLGDELSQIEQSFRLMEEKAEAVNLEYPFLAQYRELLDCYRALQSTLLTTSEETRSLPVN